MRFICLIFRLGVNPNLPTELIRFTTADEEMRLERLDTSEKKQHEAGDHWKVWCRLQDIIDISLMPEKVACRISRLSGPPLYLQFGRMAEVESFVALLGGYHRLARRFHVNLCRELVNPSLVVRFRR